MTYATEELFVEAFGELEAIELTNLDNPAATAIDSVPMFRALVDASALIDTYLGRLYRLPLATVPAVLIPCCLDIARHRLDRLRVREDVRQNYEDRIRWLEQVCKGIISLGADLLNQPVVPTQQIGTARIERGARMDLEGF
jgi:phage gp36-like protein